jgi:hypothetical protein
MRDDRKYLFVIGAGASVAFSKDIDKKIPQPNNKEDNNKKDGKEEEEKENFAHFPTGDGLLKRLKIDFISNHPFQNNWLNFSDMEKVLKEFIAKPNMHLLHKNRYIDPIHIIERLKEFYTHYYTAQNKPSVLNIEGTPSYYALMELIECAKFALNASSQFTKMQNAEKDFYDEYNKYIKLTPQVKKCLTWEETRKENSIIQASSSVADRLLTFILSSHPTKSIDYFIEKDLNKFLKREIIELKKLDNMIKPDSNFPSKSELREELTGKTFAELERLMVEFIKAKVCFILSLCHIESLEKCYFYDIIYNHIGIENFNKNAKVLTFNYDQLLEKTIESINSKEPERQIDKSLITHIYGDVESGIKFMEEREEEECKKIYQKMFEEAHYIYFLGFGFDEINAERLGIKNCNFKGKKVFICNFGGLSKVDYIIYEHFGLKARDFTLVREKSRLSQSKGFDLYISELSLQESLKTQFFF